jgi:GNAT superfamily N-acetyltransferase
VAAVEDARSILEVRRASWQIAYADVFPAERLATMTVEPWLDWWEGAIRTPATHMHTLVAEVDGRLVAFAQLGTARGEPSSSTGELYGIYAHPDAWGLGVGRALMTEALSRLGNEGFLDAVLWVLEDNPRARRFYERAGWSVDGGVKEEEWLETLVREVRYRIDLR